MKLTININNLQSIKNAQKQLLEAKKTLQEIMNNFLEDVALEIIKLANQGVDRSDIGEEVKIDIKGGWDIQKTKTGLRVYNKTQQAVFVEFGVGFEGSIKKHPQADSEGYQYNVGSKINPKTNIWIFNVKSDAEIDISQDYIINRGKTSVSTRGQPALLFAYNALVDIKTSNKLEQLWNENYGRYVK